MKKTNSDTKLPDSRKAANDPKIIQLSLHYEKALQEYWNRIPLRHEFFLQDGTSFTVLSRGNRNHEAGPDFLSAKIKIKNDILTGDVEIHRKSSDWIVHGHSNDPAYSNVILHAVEWNDISENQQRFLPLAYQFDLSCLWNTANSSQLEDHPLPQGLCSAFFSKLPEKDLLEFVDAAGMERFHLKSDEILQNMIKLGFAKAFLARFLDLLGIVANRKEFHELFERLNRYSEQDLQQHFPALLWGESGLLPDPSAEGIHEDALRISKNIWTEWWTLRNHDQEPLAFKHGGRPLNSVERRLAVLEAFYQFFTLNPFEKLFDLLEQHKEEPEALPHHLLLLWNPAESFWYTHASFTAKELKQKKALIGMDRILELLTDLIYPALFAYAKLQNNSLWMEQISRFYRFLPACGSNRILRLMEDYCFRSHGRIFKTSVSQQGLIHLYRSYCGKSSFDCKNCVLYQSV